METETLKAQSEGNNANPREIKKVNGDETFNRIIKRIVFEMNMHMDYQIKDLNPYQYLEDKAVNDALHKLYRELIENKELYVKEID